MSIEEILDLLDELLERAWGLPLSGGRIVVDAERVAELINDMRLNMPTEVKQAKAIVADRQDIITTARNEAATIISRAEDRARAMVAEEQIYKQAEQKATELLSQAQQNTREMRRATQEYVQGIMRSTEEFLGAKLMEVRNAHQTIKGQGQKKKR